MRDFNFLRLPYRHDRLFSVLALILFLIPLAFTLKTHENFETVKFCLFLALLGWAVIEFFAIAKKNHWLKTSLSKSQLLWLLGIIVFGALSTFASPNIITSLSGLYGRYTAGLVFYLAWVTFTFLLGYSLDSGKLIFLLKIVLLDGLLIAVYGLFESAGYGIYEGINAASFSRSPSFTGNPNFSGLFLAVILPFNLIFLYRAKSLYARLYYSLCAFISLWGLVVFSSRGAILAFAAGMLFILIFVFLKNRASTFSLLPVGLGAVGICLFLIFTGLVRPQVIQQTFRLQDSNISQRFYVWDLSREAIISNPVLGVGMSDFISFYDQHAGKHLAGQPSAFDDPHNLFLYQAAAGGMPFAFSFLGLIFTSMFLGVKKFFYDKDLLSLAVSAALFAFVVAASFNPVSMVGFILLPPLLAGLGAANTEKIKMKISFIPRLLLLGIGIIFLVYGLGFLTAEHMFYRGYTAYFAKDYGKAKKYSGLAEKIFPPNPLYKLYRLGAEIKISKASLENLKALKEFESSNSLTQILRSANLNFMLFMETKNSLYGSQAISLMQKAMAINSNFADRYIRVGFYSFELGLTEQALIFLNNGLAINYQNFPAWLLKAKIHQQRGQKNGMLYALRQVAKEYPEDVFLKRLIRAAEITDDIKSVPIQIGANYDRLE